MLIIIFPLKMAVAAGQILSDKANASGFISSLRMKSQDAQTNKTRPWYWSFDTDTGYANNKAND